MLHDYEGVRKLEGIDNVFSLDTRKRVVGYFYMIEKRTNYYSFTYPYSEMLF